MYCIRSRFIIAESRSSLKVGGSPRYAGP